MLQKLYISVHNNLYFENNISKNSSYNYTTVHIYIIFFFLRSLVLVKIYSNIADGM